jgi:hypothetical protein
MIDVGVGQQQRFWVEIVLRQQISDPFEVCGSVDDDTWPSAIGCDHVAIGLGKPQRAPVDYQTHQPDP